MSNVEFLENKISELTKIIQEYDNKDTNEKNTFSYNLSKNNLITDLNELHKQLRDLKEIHSKEILELRIKGYQVQNGTVPINLFSKIINHFSYIIHYASSKIIKGVDKSKISDEIINSINLRLADIQLGSAKIYLTADTSPDLFAFSLIENSLQHAFNLLNSDDENNLVDEIHQIGQISTKNISNLIKDLIKQNLEIEINWQSAAMKINRWNGSKQKLHNLVSKIDNLISSEPRIVQINGKIILISLNRIELIDIEKQKIKANFPYKLLEIIQGISVGQNIKGEFEKVTVENKMTEEKKNFYTLLKIL